MFNQFSESGRTLMAAAREEALRLQHEYIGPEHLLLAIAHEPDDKAARLLQAFDVDLAKLGKDLETEMGTGVQTETPEQLPFAPGAKRVLEQTREEAQGLGHQHLRSEHVLLALLGEGQGIVPKVLADADLNLEAVRARVAGPFG